MLISGNGDHANPVETYPKILEANVEHGSPTGYALRKGNCYDQNQCGNGKNYTACPVFRAVEALLNYLEACYERNGAIDGTAHQYWRAIRARHEGMETDYHIAINATDMNQEAKGYWGAYTAGKLVDPTLYNIRRERRNEFIAEGYPNMDLQRWRAMDQLCTTGWHAEGFHLWNTPMEEWYDAETLKNAVSPPLTQRIHPPA